MHRFALCREMDLCGSCLDGEGERGGRVCSSRSPDGRMCHVSQ